MERNAAVKRLPVVGSDGLLVGVVSRSDLLRPFTRADGDLRLDVHEWVSDAIPVVQPYRLDVSVSDGIVQLQGRVARRSQAKLAGRLAGSVGGVVAVDNQLRSDLDDTTPGPRTASVAGREPSRSRRPGRQHAALARR